MVRIKRFLNWWNSAPPPQPPIPVSGPAWLVEVALVTGEKRAIRFVDYFWWDIFLPGGFWNLLSAESQAREFVFKAGPIKWDEEDSIRIPRHQVLAYRIYQEEGKNNE